MFRHHYTPVNDSAMSALHVQVDNDEIAAADAVGDNDNEDDDKVQSPHLLSFLDDFETSAHTAARFVVVVVAANLPYLTDTLLREVAHCHCEN